MEQSVVKNSELSIKDQEMILVVKRETLFPEGAWQGIREVCFDSYLSLVQMHKEFILRGYAEQDETYKQIIPYLIFEHNDTYFLMQRSAQASETRLQNKFSLGIGGHVRQEDLKGGSLFEWAQREFHEEIAYEGKLVCEPLGLLNDDSDAVGRVHAGFVFLLKGDSNQIAVKSELKSGTLVPLEECMQYHKHLEQWSQMVLICLLDKKYGAMPTKCCC